MSSSPRVGIITAFAAESRPIRKHLNLRREDHASLPFPVYRSDTCLLIESGMGKLRAAAAVAGLLACEPSIRGVINVGIAGGTEAMGSCCLAHAVTDRASGRTWYPDLPPQRSLLDVNAHNHVETVDEPDSGYRADRIFDMEAAGIFSAATPILGTAGVQCLKIISDGPEASLEALDKAAVSRLLGAHVLMCAALVDYLSGRQEPAREHRTQVSDAVKKLEAEVGRHTVSERHRLSALLSRYLALNSSLPSTRSLGLPDSAALLAERLQRRVDDHSTARDPS